MFPLLPGGEGWDEGERYLTFPGVHKDFYRASLFLHRRVTASRQRLDCARLLVHRSLLAKEEAPLSTSLRCRSFEASLMLVSLSLAALIPQVRTFSLTSTKLFVITPA